MVQVVRSPGIEIVRPGGKGSKWWVRLRAANHRIVFVSETYRSARAARRAAAILSDLGTIGPLEIIERTR